MKILMAASECVPFIKTGGLADVLGALPKALLAAGEDVRVVLPKYGEIGEEYRSQMTTVCYFYVNLGWRRQYCGVESLKLNGITYSAAPVTLTVVVGPQDDGDNASLLEIKSGEKIVLCDNCGRILFNAD